MPRVRLIDYHAWKRRRRTQARARVVRNYLRQVEASLHARISNRTLVDEQLLEIHSDIRRGARGIERLFHLEGE